MHARINNIAPCPMYLPLFHFGSTLLAWDFQPLADLSPIKADTPAFPMASLIHTLNIRCNRPYRRHYTMIIRGTQFNLELTSVLDTGKLFPGKFDKCLAAPPSESLDESLVDPVGQPWLQPLCGNYGHCRDSPTFL